MLYGGGFAIALAIGVFLLLEVGRRIGARRIAAEGKGATEGFVAIESAVFGLMGLILAFCFSGAANRFDGRRQLVVTEVNQIGTAWLRIDLLPMENQPAMRDLFRQYLDSRIETYRKVPDVVAVNAERARTAELQRAIWSLAVAGVQKSQTPAAPVLVLPALNEMIDTTTTRAEATRVHPPVITYVMLGVLALACSLFAGYDMAARPRLNLLHATAFALALAVTVYVIVDLEYPRIGLIRMTDSDTAMVELRQTMN